MDNHYQINNYSFHNQLYQQHHSSQDEKNVYWTDIAGGRLFKYDPETGDPIYE